MLFGGEFGEDVGVFVFEGAMDEAAISGGEGAVVEEKFGGVFGADELLILRVVGDGWNDDVDSLSRRSLVRRRMVLGLATPGVEDGGEVKFDVGCFEFCGGDVVEGLGGAFEEEGVEGFGLMMAEGAELLGDGEGDHLSRRSLGVGG